MSTLKTIEIALKANVAGFSAGMGVASAQARQFSKDMTDWGKTTDKHLDKIGKASMVLGAGMLAGFGIAANAAMGFEKQMSEVGAVSDATAGELNALRQAAIDAGAATVFSASQAAVAEAELAKAGISTSDILGGALTGSLNLASAGNLDLGRSAEIAANAMTTFGLKGSDVGHVADVLAAGANKSAADVEDMGQALQQSGLVAAQLGLTLDDTSAALAMFAQSGLRGSDAGTSLKTMLLSLNPKSKEAAEEMSRLGLKFFDARGQFVGLEGAAGQLQSAMSGLTQEQRLSSMQTIFGTDAIRAANILYAQGAAGVADWTAKVNDQGYAAELAAKKTDNLAGDLEQLKGSIETGLIQGGSQATGSLRSLTQAATETVNAFSAMPAGMQAVTMGVLGIGGAVTFVGGAAATALPKYRQLLSTLEEMGPGGVKAASAISKLSRGLSAGTIAVAGMATAWTIWNAKVSEADQKATELHDRLAAGWVKDTTSMADLNRQLEQIATQRQSMLTDMQAFQNSAERFNPLEADWTAEQIRYWEGLARSGQELGAFTQRVTALSAATGASEEQVKRWLSSLPDLGASYTSMTAAVHDFGVAQVAAAGLLPQSKGLLDTVKGAFGDTGDTIEDTTKKLDRWHDAVRAQFDPLFAMQDAMTGLDDAQRKATEAAVEYQQAGATYGWGSDQAAEALRRLEAAQNDVLRSNVDLDQAAADLFAGINNGTTNIDEVKASIDSWTASGRINAAQADVLKGRIDRLAFSAGVFSTLTPLARLGLDTSMFDAGMARVTAALASIGAVIRAVSTVGATGALAAGQFGSLFGAGVGGLAGTVRPVVVAPGPGQASSSWYVPFADGGEYHSAQIAGAGANRLWAEPETGGESYIPHAMSKRGRSTVVLAETARRFGYTLAPAGATTSMGAPTGGSQIDQRSYTASFPNYVGDRADLERWMEGRMRDLIRSKAD